MREERLAGEFRFRNFVGDSLAFAILGEADGDSLTGEVNECADDVIFAESCAKVFELAVGTWKSRCLLLEPLFMIQSMSHFRGLINRTNHNSVFILCYSYF